MLGQTHCPAGDDRPSPAIGVGGGFDFLTGQAALCCEVIPLHCLKCGAPFGEAGGVLINKLLIQHRAGRLGFGGKQRFLHALEQRHVAIDFYLQILLGQRRGHAEHAAHFLRMRKAQQTGFLQGIHRHDLGTVAFGGLQRAEHARVVGAGVLAEDKNGFGLFEVLQGYGAFADADGGFEGGAAGFVAHV